MRVWLDDNRPPWRYGRLGWEWAKSYEEMIKFLETGKVVEVDLDHDLTEKATTGDWSGELTGFEVLEWMLARKIFPHQGVHIHSLNEEGRIRMRPLVDRIKAYSRRRIVEAAVLVDGEVFTGRRHPDAMAAARAAKPNQSIGQKAQGFVTAEGQFVSREKAAQLAFDAGQIRKPTEILASEDLW